MKPLTYLSRFCLLLVGVLFLIACQSEVVEVTKIVTQTEEIAVTQVVEVEGETIVQEVVVTATAGGSGPISVAPLSTPSPAGTRPLNVTPIPFPQPQITATPQDVTFQDYGVNPFVLTSVDNLSTFSLDVDTGSYSLARRWLDDGLMPPPEAVRVEEFVNYFDQGYAIPDNASFAVYADGAPSPFHSDGTVLVRIGVQGYEVAEVERSAAALTFVIDASGSMADGGRLEIVKQSLNTLVNRLRPDDTVAIVAYSNNAWIVLNPTPATERTAILNAIYSLQPGASTNLEAGLLLGYQLANQAYKPGGINRVILASDGVANVGNTTADAILEQSRSYAEAGIYLTSIGVGMNNYNDVMLEQLADKGEGNYYYVDTVEEAETVFVDNLTSTLQVIALDAKIQVEFDPQVVQQYRLLGYENRAIADQDFRNDAIDAAEFGAGHTAAAIYAIQLYPGVQGRIATVNLRWQDPATRQVTEINGEFMTDNLVSSFDAANPHLQLAILVAQFAELLRHSPYSDSTTLADIRVRAERLMGSLDGDLKVLDFVTMVTRASELQG